MEETFVALLLAHPPLSSLVATRIKWSARLQGTPLPAVVMFRVGGRRDTVMDGASGLVESRVQIDCYGRTYTEAKQVARAVIGVVNGARYPEQGLAGLFLDAERDTHEGEDPDPVFRTSLDVRVWHHEA